jgi:hypothetical protein
MAAAFNGVVSSPAPRWQLQPSLTFDYEHGDRTRTGTEEILGLERVPALEVVWLWGTSVTDVRHLASAKALKQLSLSDTKVTSASTMGLECIPTLETLFLSSTSVTDVRHLASAKALKQLCLSDTRVTSESTMGLECIPTLETLNLSATSVTDVRHLASAKALKQLDLSNTKVTTEGTMGLECIPTLETLLLSSTSVTDVRHLASAKALTTLDLADTKVTVTGDGLERAVEAAEHHRSGRLTRKIQSMSRRSIELQPAGAAGLLQRGTNKRSPFVESFEGIPLGSVFASGASAQIRSVAGRPDTLAKIYHHHVLSNAES